MSELHFSDEQLNAFIDHELSQAEQLEILQAATDSDPLRSRLVQLQYLKALTRAAYPPTGQPSRQQTRAWTGGGFTRYLAAAAMGALSLFAVHSMTDQAPSGATSTQKPLASLDRMQQAQTRVVFHISSDNRDDAALLLDQVELVLQEHRASGRPLRLEVVANNQGLRLMQRNRSPFPERIRQLSESYPNLVFAACGSTLERLTKATGEQIQILPEAVIIRSGVSYITRRQRTGWAYIKV